MELCLKILGADMGMKAVSRGVDEANLVYSQEYEPDDRIILETSGEAVFAAQNAVDGITANHCHGEWPY